MVVSLARFRYRMEVGGPGVGTPRGRGMQHESGTLSALRRETRPRAAGFTLIDVLVSLAVVAVIIAITLPSIGLVRESARRVVCGSGMRQLGLGVTMYADDNRGFIPSSAFVTGNVEDGDSLDTVVVRFDRSRLGGTVSGRPQEVAVWDGLGLAFSESYLAAANVYYCPSHKGEVRFERYAPMWAGDSGEIVTNYQYRAEGPDGQRRLDRIASAAPLATDALRSLGELNHDNGFNALSASLSVGWADDGDGQIELFLASIASGSMNSPSGDDEGSDIWRVVDHVTIGGSNSDDGSTP